MPLDLCQRAEGLLLGAAVGDAMGLRREGLSPAHAVRCFGATLTPGLIAGRMLLSDDSEHAVMTAQALLAAHGDPARFRRRLAWKLRGWLACLPPAIGLATLRACVKLCLGWSSQRSGVGSAGNGPLMRAPVLGFAARHAAQRHALVDASTRLTHTHPLALEAAQALAAATACARDGVVTADAVLAEITPYLRDDAWRRPLALLAAALAHGDEPAAWARAAGLTDGVTGFVVDTLPAALLCWLRRPLDVRGAILDVIALGGDTDSTAAIVGALAGTAAGARAVPAEWSARIVDWPLSVAWLRRLAPRLAACAHGESCAPAPMPWRAALPLRNLVFLVVVVAVVVRRALARARP